MPPTLPDSPDEDHLARLLAGADPADVDAFWAQAARRGTPIPLPDGRVTFLHRGPGPAHLALNRVTDKTRHALGAMRRIDGTDVHVRTLELTPTLRASYSIRVGAAAAPRPGPPPHDGFDGLVDPLNPRVLVDAGDGRGLSEHVGPLAPDLPDWSGPPEACTAHHAALPLDHGGRTVVHPVRLHLPPEDLRTPEMPLLTCLDGETWTRRLDLPAALARAARAGRIPPTALLSVGSGGRATRTSALGANRAFLASLTGAADWARRVLAGHGIAADEARWPLAGQSLGGLSGVLAAATGIGGFTGVVASSPSTWFDPGRPGTPADLGSRPVDWITALVAGTRGRPGRRAPVVLSAGAREGLLSARAAVLAQTLGAVGHPVRFGVVDGGHDVAWWRGALVDGLAALHGGGGVA